MAICPWREPHGDAVAGARVLGTGGAGFLGSPLQVNWRRRVETGFGVTVQWYRSAVAVR